MADDFIPLKKEPLTIGDHYRHGFALVDALIEHGGSSHAYQEAARIDAEDQRRESAASVAEQFSIGIAHNIAHGAGYTEGLVIGVQHNLTHALGELLAPATPAPSPDAKAPANPKIR